jgi:hypothetical protein
VTEGVYSIDGMTLTEEKKLLAQNPVPAPFCPPKIPRGLAWDRNRSSERTDGRLPTLALKHSHANVRVHGGSGTTGAWD